MHVWDCKQVGLLTEFNGIKDQVFGPVKGSTFVCLKIDEAADRAASVSAYVGFISAVQTLEQTHSEEQALYHMPGWLTLTKASTATLPRQSAQKHM